MVASCSSALGAFVLHPSTASLQARASASSLSRWADAGIVCRRVVAASTASRANFKRLEAVIPSEASFIRTTVRNQAGVFRGAVRPDRVEAW